MKAHASIVLLLVTVGCSTLPTRTPASDETIAAAVTIAATALTAELRPHVHRLETSFDTYNYTTRESLHVSPQGELDLEDSSITDHVTSTSEYFWHLDQPNDNRDTRGLYLATDPVASRSFGRDHWLLFRVQLPVGLPYLDLEAVDRQPVPEETQRLIQAAGCDDPNKYNHLLRKNVGAACRQIGLAVLRNLEVQAIFYGWTSVNFRDCSNRQDGAFILLHGLPAAQVQPFYAESTGLEEERTAIENLFLQQTSLNGSDGLVSTYLRPWPSLDDAATDLSAWTQEHLMFCR